MRGNPFFPSKYLQHLRPQIRETNLGLATSKTSPKSRWSQSWKIIGNML